MVDLNKDFGYEKYINSPLLQSVFPESLYNYMGLSGEKTGEIKGDMWKKNTDRNYDRLFKDCGAVGEQLLGLAKNKAVIMVGGGPSFNKNKKLLKTVYDFNITFPLDQQPFVIMASNHMLKPLLKMGIFPHLTVILDGGNHFRDQFLNLDTDFKCVFIANMATDHKVLKRLVRDGHKVSFFISDSNENRNIYSEKTGKDPENICTFTGGNVMNTSWMIALRFLHSRFGITLGNDLSFPLIKDVDERRKAFYSDGDYTSNDKDEANHNIAWMAYEHAGKGTFDESSQLINYEKVLTSHQLLLYKAWIEMHVAKWWESEDFTFRYYNCSEGGITGVLAKHQAVEDLENERNWMLMDELAPNRWFTKPLRNAVEDFLEIRQSCQVETESVASNIITSPQKMDFVKNVVPVGQSRIIKI
jgi:hypothetical protein